MTALLLIGGLIGLVVGADLLVRGASGLAVRLRLSSLVIGLTVVAYGTSMPEAAVSLDAVQRGRDSIALGNVVGSNTMNVLLILGLSALIAPLSVRRQLLRIDVPILIGASFLGFVMALDGALEWTDGVILLLCAAAYTAFTVIEGRRQSAANGHGSDGDAPSKPALPWPLQLALLAVGVVLLGAGADWFVEGATDVARRFGLSDTVIGLTVVAIGTSLPEVATSIVAAVRGERDMAVGNVVGSNIFNVLFILGTASVFDPDVFQVEPAVLRFDLPVMVAVALALAPVALARGRIARWEGGFFLVLYVGYTTYLLLASQHYDGLENIDAAVLQFVLPLLVVTLVVLAIHGLMREDRTRR